MLFYVFLNPDTDFYGVLFYLFAHFGFDSDFYLHLLLLLVFAIGSALVFRLMAFWLLDSSGLLSIFFSIILFDIELSYGLKVSFSKDFLR